MRFGQAKKKLAEIANGKYRSLRYEKVTHSDGEEVTECSIYIDGETYHSGNTWERTFAVREAFLKPKKAKIEVEP
ncbi:hypothetical protein ES708_00723 [subsurface metagenome]